MEREQGAAEAALTEAVAAIHAARGHSNKDGLKHMRQLCALLDDPQDGLIAIHVAGTNGKGSVCACLDAVLREAGYRVGLYTSPFLQQYQERIRIDGQPIDAHAFLRAYAPVRAAAEALRAQGVLPTPFELGTALAFVAFAQAGVDVCVLEVGLGGRLDPTNVVTPRIAAIAAIGMDHSAILGDTVEAIAAEKAGIIKSGVPVVTQAAQASVAEVFARAAQEKGAPWHPLTGAEMTASGASFSWTGQKGDFAWRGWALPGLTLRLLGAHQLHNAGTALAVLALLREGGWRVPDEAARRGLASVHWPARLEYVPGEPPMLLDGAHNAQGAQALAAFAEALPAPPWAERVLLCGILAKKISEDMLDALASLAPRAVVTEPPEQQPVPAQDLADALARRGVRVTVCAQPGRALAQARALTGAQGLLIAAGSLYLVGALRTELDLTP